jgi:hypothetical protein
MSVMNLAARQILNFAKKFCGSSFKSKLSISDLSQVEFGEESASEVTKN